MAQKLKITIVTFCTVFLLGSFLPALVSAASATPDAPQRQASQIPSTCASGKVQVNPDAASDASAPAKICVPLGNGCVGGTSQECLKQTPLVIDINNIVNFLSGLVGVVIVGVIILGGIQYAAAGDKAEAVSAAKKRITDAIIALVAFFFIFAFLQWLIPGGIFS